MNEIDEFENKDINLPIEIYNYKEIIKYSSKIYSTFNFNLYKKAKDKKNYLQKNLNIIRKQHKKIMSNITNEIYNYLNSLIKKYNRNHYDKNLFSEEFFNNCKLITRNVNKFLTQSFEESFNKFIITLYEQKMLEDWLLIDYVYLIYESIWDVLSNDPDFKLSDEIIDSDPILQNLNMYPICKNNKLSNESIIKLFNNKKIDFSSVRYLICNENVHLNEDTIELICISENDKDRIFNSIASGWKISLDNLIKYSSHFRDRKYFILNNRLIDKDVKDKFSNYINLTE